MTKHIYLEDVYLCSSAIKKKKVYHLSASSNTLLLAFELFLVISEYLLEENYVTRAWKKCE